MWTANQISLHEKAAKNLALVKDEVLEFLRNQKNITEKDVLDFVLSSYKKHGLKNDDKKEFAIVAFGKNTKEVHYFPKGKGTKLKPNTLILLDLWARMGEKDAPYADMTWMAFKGKKIPVDIQKKWKVLASARDQALEKIESCLKHRTLPRGLDIDRAAHDILGAAGFGENIKHTVGHSLGTKHPHGKLPGINWREYRTIKKCHGYTIEPGIYLENMGLRTEIDFCVSEKNKIVITTPVQKDIDVV